MAAPLISVVIPTRHRDDTLADCLRRLAPGAQTLPADRYEVIVTDDGLATTAEAMVCERFPWARWTAGPRRGPAANRNHGVAVTRSNWIAFTDDDCLPSSDWLAAYVAAIAMAGPADVLEGQTTCEADLPSVLYESPINLHGGLLYSCNMALPRATVERIGGFDERFPHTSLEDIEFHLRLKASGHHTVFVPAAVVDHPPRRRHLGIGAGRRWEGRVLLSHLWPESQRPWWPSHVFKIRVMDLCRGRPGFDWVRFAVMSIPEVLTVAWHAGQWERRYRAAKPMTANASVESRTTAGRI